MQVNAHRDAPKRNKHSTKAGPGRRHAQGHKRVSTVAPKGGAWLGQHTNEKKNAQRAVKREIGARQYRKQVKALRREAMSA
jgi:hypothetical protein